MNQAALWVAIYARLTGDTGTGGLFNVGNELVAGVYNTMPTELQVNEDSKYVVFSVASASQGDAFDMDVVEYTFRLSVFTPVKAGLTAASAIIDRVYGNGVASSGNLATYGLHRWLPSLSGGWTATVCQRVDQDTNHSEDVYQFVETFRVTCSKA